MSDYELIDEVVEINNTRFSIIELAFVIEDPEDSSDQSETPNINTEVISIDSSEDEQEINPMEMLSFEMETSEPKWTYPGNHFECNICQAIFTTSEARDNHIQERHESINCYICKTNIKKDQIKNHMIEVHDKTCKCAYCNKWFKVSGWLQQHQKKCRAKILEKEAKFFN